jgi:hypothetical protein
VFFAGRGNPENALQKFLDCRVAKNAPRNDAAVKKSLSDLYT